MNVNDGVLRIIDILAGVAGIFHADSRYTRIRVSKERIQRIARRKTRILDYEHAADFKREAFGIIRGPRGGHDEDHDK